MDSTQGALEHIERTLIALVREEGEQVRKVWQKEHTVTQKDVRDVVTEVDVHVEQSLRKKILALMPEAGFVVEEGASTDEREWMWVIDPIDQTKNFVGRVPLFYVQVALTYHQEPVVTVVYNPISGDVFSASRGNGARLNGAQLPAHSSRTLAESVLDIDFGGQDDVARKSKVFQALAERAYRVRMTGGAYAPFLLTGGIDAFISLSQRTKSVDQVPRLLLAREAGFRAEVVSIGGFQFYVYAGDSVSRELIDCLKEVYQ